MKSRSALVFALGALCLAAAVPAAPAVTSKAKRSCDTIRLGKVRVFYKHNMRCAKAKRLARRLYRSEGRNRPRKFVCQSGSNFNSGGSCRHRSKNRYFGWHPFDKRATAARRASCKPVRNPYPGTRFDGIDLTHIKADGVACSKARRVAERAHKRGLGLIPSPNGTRTYRWNGWKVRANLRPARDRYVATRRHKKVRFRF